MSMDNHSNLANHHATVKWCPAKNFPGGALVLKLLLYMSELVDYCNYC